MEKEEYLINELKEKKAGSTDTVPYFKLYKYSTPFDLLLIWMGIIGSIICGIIQPYVMVLFGDVIGVIADNAESIRQNLTEDERVVLMEKLFSGTQQFAIPSSLCVAITFFCTYATGFCFNYSSLRQTLKMRKLFFGKILDQDISWHDQNQIGDLTKILTDNIPKIEAGIGQKIGKLLNIQTTYIACVVWAYLKGWQFAFICLITFPLKTVIYVIFTKCLEKRLKKEIATYVAAGGVAGEVLKSIKTVVAFGAEEKEFKRYKHYTKKAESQNITRCFFNALNLALYWFLIFARYGFALWYGINFIIEGRNLPEEERIYTPGNVMGIFFLNIVMSWHFGTMGPYYIVIKTARTAAFKIFKILDSEPVTNKHIDIGRRPDFTSKIVFRNVKFSYPATPDAQVLNDINMEVSFGETIALVGRKGSGISTMVQLLQRFYDPTSGEITIGGDDLKDIHLSYLREHIGVVSVKPVLFSTTIAENIRYGKMTATFFDIVKAAKKANAHQFISDLPSGYHTIIDESEAQLSEHQKLRITLARALIKEPHLIILDEVTSPMNTDRKLEVQATLDAINKECTKIVITDRPSTIINASRIIVFDKGNIIEQGSYYELMEAEGAFYNMINSEEETEMSNENKNKLLETETAPFISYGEKADEKVIEEKDTDAEVNKNLYIKLIQFYRPEWLHIVVGCLASLIKGALIPIYGLVLGNFIGALCVTDNTALRIETNSYCLAFLYIGIATGIVTFVQMFSFNYANVKTKNRMRTNMFNTMLKQEIGWFDRNENSFLTLCIRLAFDPVRVQPPGGIGFALNSLSALFLSIVIGLYLEWRLTLLIFILYPLIIFGILYERRFTNREADFIRNRSEKSAKMAAEALGNIHTVKALGCENIVYESYLKELKSSKIVRFWSLQKRAVILGCTKGLQFLAFTAGIVYGAKLLSQVEIDSATLFKVLEVTITSAWYTGSNMSLLPNMENVIPAASRIFALFKRVPAVKSNANSTEYQWENPNVKFSRIDFSYPIRSSVQVLNNFELSIMPGKTVALVGGNSFDNSAVLQLLLRFYDPSYGAVSVDGEDIRNLNLHSLRSQMGLVSQNPDIFNLTIAENIGYGVNERTVTMEEIVEAAKSANIHNFIVSLPLGYETELGSKGKQLFRSQKLRIAVARALIRNPKILLLDQVTSLLDAQSAKVLQEVIDRARLGRTCIMVSENLTTLQKADIICVLKERQIAETGSHDQLLAMKGHYYKYYNLRSTTT